MTEPIHTRAAEIIAAYGADPARWPGDERASALAAIAASSELRAAQASAVRLDADLTAWAVAPVVVGDPAAAVAAAMRPRRLVLRWAGGTGIAAAVAAGLILLAPHPTAAPRTAAVRAPVATDERATFAQVFTPMPDEEQQL